MLYTYTVVNDKICPRDANSEKIACFPLFCQPSLCYKLCVMEITLFQNIKLLIKETTQGNFPVEQYMLWDNSSHCFFNEFLA